MTTKMFGEPIPRREDPRLVTGQGRFLDDLGGQALAAAFVRSPHAHARVVDIDVAGALDVEGLVAIYTWDDLEGRLAEPLPLLIPHPSLTHGRTAYPLARDVVRHVGEPVAMVVATDRYVAEDAADRILVDYEPLSPVVGIEAAAAADHLVHDDVPGNVGAHLVQEVAGAEGRSAAAAIDDAPHRLEFRLAIERSASSPLEGRGVYARWDGDDGSLRVYSSTQTSTSVRMAIAAKLDLPPAKVEVIAPDVGGGFGVKIVHPWPEEILIPWAARLLGREVKWTEDRREHFISSAHERGQVHYVRVGFDDDGRVLGLDVRFLHDHGAYTPYGVIVPIITSTQLLGPYKVGAYRVEFTSLYTNTVQVTPYRGAGRPQAVFCMERTMDRIAAHLGRDRTSVRAANLIQPGDFPYDQGLTFQDGRPLIYDSGDYPELLRMVKDLIGWEDFGKAQTEAAAAGRRLGLGLACYVEGTGVGPYEGGHVEVDSSGRVHVSTGLTSQGQGHQTVFAQIAAAELGVPIDDVTVTTGDTRRFRYAVGTFASRAAVLSGNAIALACRALRDKALRIAAEALEADPRDLEIDDGVVRIKGNPTASIPLRTVAVLSNPLRYAFDAEAARATQFAVGGSADRPPVAEGDQPGLEGTDYYSPVRSTFAAGAHAAIVETDPDTAEVRVLRYAVVHDCGRLINPRIVEGQIHGGVAQGIANALLEEIIYDDTGNILTASLADYLPPTAREIPPIEIHHLETWTQASITKAKGLGEGGAIGAPAAVVNAINDALAPFGVAIDEFPATPQRIRAALRAAGTRA
jgi:aerobic carbon-monoxide dehydrogenase large subunit